MIIQIEILTLQLNNEKKMVALGKGQSIIEDKKQQNGERETEEQPTRVKKSSHPFDGQQGIVVTHQLFHYLSVKPCIHTCTKNNF